MTTRLPPLDLLRGFEAAARHLSFTRAADELSLTQSAVSRQIKALEDNLGAALFRRQHMRMPKAAACIFHIIRLQPTQLVIHTLAFNTAPCRL